MHVKYSKYIVSLLFVGTMIGTTGISVSATNPAELKTLDYEVVKDIISSTPKTEINQFELKKDIRKLFEFESYQNLGIVQDVEEFLNIYESEDTNSKVIGKIPLNGGCEILSQNDGFTQIKSGKISGFVESKYLATNTDALLKVLEISYELADVKEDTKIYTEMDETSEVLQEVYVNSRFMIEEKTLDWIKVKLEDNKTGYIQATKVAILPELKVAEEVKETTEEKTRVVVEKGIISNYSFDVGIPSGAEAGSLREQIINYALDFVGNPYVWGGTNPYTGADCSGFVQYIYNHFGYHIPRTTDQQWDWAKANGKIISPSEAQAGDLVLYRGHVAMLTGNGNEIVHASNSAPYPQGGIKITSDYNYKPILGIVRVI